MTDHFQDQVYLRSPKPGDWETLDGMSDTSFRFTSGDIPPIPDHPHRSSPGESLTGHFSFAIVAGHRLVGEVHFSDLRLEARSCRLTMGIAHRADRGRGIGKRALQLALTYAFYTLGLDKVTANTRDENPRAVASLLGSGFRLTGSETGFLSHSKEQIHHLYYTITLDEFNELKSMGSHHTVPSPIK